jgi:ferredoxin
MTYVIAPGCVADFSCVEVCPADCIHPTPDEPGYRTAEQLYINPAECIDCAACEEACPVDAVHAASQLPARWASAIEVNAAHFGQVPR